MLDVKSHLMRRQRYFSATLDHFQFHHDKNAMRECKQTIRYA